MTDWEKEVRGLIYQLKKYGCPVKITDELGEWLKKWKPEDNYDKYDK